MLLLLDPLNQGRFIIIWMDGNASLNDGRSSVELISNKVDRCPVVTVLGLQCPAMSVKAGVLGEQGGVNVHHPPLIMRHEFSSQNAHETSQNDEVRLVLVNGFHQCLIKAVAIREARVIHHLCWDTCPLGAREAANLRPVADHHDNVAAQLLTLLSINQCLQVGAAA